MSDTRNPPVVPDLPVKATTLRSGLHVVAVDVTEATQAVVWHGPWPTASMARYRAPSRLRFFTTVDTAVGALIQLETDGLCALFQVVPEDEAAAIDLPLIAIGVARHA